MQEEDHHCPKVSSDEFTLLDLRYSDISLLSHHVTKVPLAYHIFQGV